MHRFSIERRKSKRAASDESLKLCKTDSPRMKKNTFGSQGPFILNLEPSVQEPVRLFLEKLHPQKKLSHESPFCRRNSKTFDDEKDAMAEQNSRPLCQTSPRRIDPFLTSDIFSSNKSKQHFSDDSRIPTLCDMGNDTLSLKNMAQLWFESPRAGQKTDHARFRIGISTDTFERSPKLPSYLPNLTSQARMKFTSDLSKIDRKDETSFRHESRKPPASDFPKQSPREKSKSSPGGTFRRPSASLEKQTSHPALVTSIFPKVPPCLWFPEENQRSEHLPSEFRKLLYWRSSLATPTIVKQVLARAHFRVSSTTSATDDLDAIESSDWIYYFGKHLKPEVFHSIQDYQKVNHFPCSFHLGRKDRLWRNICAMQKKCGLKNFDFTPLTFCMPADFDKFKAAWETEGEEHQWILKPPASARGLGVKVVNKWSQIPKRRPLIVQRYLNNPYLINNSKFDLRIYVFIYSVHPLLVFVHEEGLVRFASHRYTNSPRYVGNRYVHLTNYSINRQNVDYVSNTSDETCVGHKWSLRAFWAYLRSHNVPPEPVWSSIKDVIAKTCIAIEPHLKTAVENYCRTAYSVQELFGFDIFLDENLKPWLLEVNVSPSLHIDSPLDTKVKGTMVRDMLNLTGINLPTLKDISNASVRIPVLPRMPPFQHLNIIPDSEESLFTPRSTNFDDSPELIDINGDPTKSIRKPPSPPSHPWVLDRRLTMTKLGEDEKNKHAYYESRASEAIRDEDYTNTSTPCQLEPPHELKVTQSDINKPELPSPPIASREDTNSSNCISQAAGPDDSFDLFEFIRAQKNKKKEMEEKRKERIKLLQRIVTHAQEAEVKEPKSSGSLDQEGDEPPQEPEPKNPLLESFRVAASHILDRITPFDLRCLIQLLDTKHRAGAFQSVFPADSPATMSSYLQLFEKPRYANLLIFAYLDKYGYSKEGISMLTDLCEKEVHLKSRFFGDVLDERNIWEPPSHPETPRENVGKIRAKKRVTFS